MGDDNDIQPDPAEQPEDQAELLAEPDPKLTKRRGRPKGLPKTGGRQKAPPPTTAELRAMLASIDGVSALKRIIEGAPVRVTSSVGKPFDALPSISDRLRALDIWTSRLLPALQSQQISADVKADVTSRDGGEVSDIEMARHVAWMLTQGEKAARAKGTTIIEADTSPAIKQILANTLDPPSPDEPPAYLSVRPDPVPPQARPSELPAWAHSPTPSQAVVHLEEHRRNLHAARPDERPPPGTVGPPAGRADQLQEGERILTDAGTWIEYTGTTNGDGRQRFWVVDRHGQRVATIWGKDEAIAKARELGTKGSISK
jgi:hypothetical protein